MSISLKRKKKFGKEKHHPSVFRKAFQISRKYVSCHIHFNAKCFIIEQGKGTFVGDGSQVLRVHFIGSCHTTQSSGMS